MHQELADPDTNYRIKVDPAVRKHDPRSAHEVGSSGIQIRDMTSNQKIGVFAESHREFPAVVARDESRCLAKTRTVIDKERLTKILGQRTVELAVANIERRLEIDQRKKVETELRSAEMRNKKLLARSTRLHGHYRLLSRRFLSTQEEERKLISHELHDVIAQTLAGINISLSALKMEAEADTRGLVQNIARTQLLVTKSVEIVHQFACNLRPSVLDNLGIIPALKSVMTGITARTGIRMHLSADEIADRLTIAQSTVLFRIAQEALVNVTKHADASCVTIAIRKQPDGVHMTIHDNGKSFQFNRVMAVSGGKCLGLIGMRERLEMLQGRFDCHSAPGQGTTITAQLPLAKVTAKRKRKVNESRLAVK